MPDDTSDTINTTYDRVLQLRHSWDMNAKEMEEWKKQYINEWAGEGTSTATYATYSPSISAPVRIFMKDGKLCLEWTVEEESNEPKGWETL